MSERPSLEGVLAKALDTEPVRNLTSPATKEIGELLGNIASVARYYGTENLEKIFVKWARNRRANGRTIDAEDFKRIMPLLPQASMQSDDELQDRWAALLESTVCNPGSVLPSFARTLSEIDADEARFLERLLPVAEDVKSEWSGGHQDGEMDYGAVLAAYDSRLQEGPLDLTLFSRPKSIHDPVLLGRAALVIDDLVRLGILTIRYDTVVGGAGDGYVDATTAKWYSFSAYGHQFMRAVAPSQKEGN